jgi:hypothetical protein
MSAAILQGCPATTLNTELWIDWPPRQYVIVLKLCENLGAHILANTVVELEDGSLINFLSRVDGLEDFSREYKKSVGVRWQGTTVRVLSLASIIRRKREVGRPKDIAHLPLLAQTLKLRRRTR